MSKRNNRAALPSGSLRIAIFQETYLPIRGGAEMHVYYLARALLRAGHDVEVFTTTPGGPAEGDVQCVNRHHLHRGMLYPLRFPYWAWIIFKAALRSDVLHAHYSSFLAAMVVAIGRLTGRPSAVTLHGFGTLDSSVGRSPLRRAYRWISLTLADQVIATSQEMAEVAERFAPRERIAIITNGVDTEAFPPTIGSRFDDVKDQLRLVTLRRLVPKNGVQFSVQAAAALHMQGAPVRLEIVGDGGLRQLIRLRIEELGLADSFVMYGALPHDQVLERLRCAHVALFLSTAESTSLAALECMAQGCLVVASNVGAFPEFIDDGKTGFLVPLFEHGRSNYVAPNALTETQLAAVTSLLEGIRRWSPAALEEIARNARHVVETNFDWGHIAHRTVVEAYRGGRG